MSNLQGAIIVSEHISFSKSLISFVILQVTVCSWVKLGNSPGKFFDFFSQYDGAILLYSLPSSDFWLVLIHPLTGQQCCKEKEETLFKGSLPSLPPEAPPVVHPESSSLPTLQGWGERFPFPRKAAAMRKRVAKADRCLLRKTSDPEQISPLPSSFPWMPR